MIERILHFFLIKRFVFFFQFVQKIEIAYFTNFEKIVVSKNYVKFMEEWILVSEECQRFVRQFSPYETFDKQ